MTKYITALTILVFSLATSTFGQAHQISKEPTSVWIGIQLQLGMSRDTVITKLTPDYSVTKVKTQGDDWIVADKNSPEIWHGYLGFHDGKLTYASKSWTQGDEDSYGLAQAFWGAMSQMDKEGSRSCSFDVPSSTSPMAEMRFVRLYCGAKRIEIMITNVLNGEGKGHHVSINEILSSEKAR